MITRGSLNDYLFGFKQPKMIVCQMWFRQILTGLECLHSRGIIHGYLSCDHIYINSNTGEVKIGDVFLVKVLERLSDMGGVKKPHEDIQHFGLVALELAFIQLFSSKFKHRKWIGTLYENPRTDKSKIAKLINYIEDPIYKSLVGLCVFADSNVTVAKVLDHPFFSTVYNKDDLLKANKVMSKAKTTRNAPLMLPINLAPVKRPIINVTRNTLKEQPNSDSTIVNISIKVMYPEKALLVSFTYDIHHDTPETVAREMSAIKLLPESYITAIQHHIAQIGKLKHYIVLVNDYCEHKLRLAMEARESESDCKDISG